MRRIFNLSANKLLLPNFRNFSKRCVFTCIKSTWVKCIPFCMKTLISINGHDAFFCKEEPDLFIKRKNQLQNATSNIYNVECKSVFLVLSSSEYISVLPKFWQDVISFFFLPHYSLNQCHNPPRRCIIRHKADKHFLDIQNAICCWRIIHFSATSQNAAVSWQIRRRDRGHSS